MPTNKGKATAQMPKHLSSDQVIAYLTEREEQKLKEEEEKQRRKEERDQKRLKREAEKKRKQLEKAEKERQRCTRGGRSRGSSHEDLDTDVFNYQVSCLWIHRKWN